MAALNHKNETETPPRGCFSLVKKGQKFKKYSSKPKEEVIRLCFEEKQDLSIKLCLVSIPKIEKL